MNNEENKNSSKEEIDLENLETLIINYTKELMDYQMYIELLKDKIEIEEEVTKKPKSK